MSKEEAPVLGPNTTVERLVDELGEWNEKRKAAEKQENFFKTAFKARLEEDDAIIEGDEFTGIAEGCSRATVDYKQILEDNGIELTPEILTQYTKNTSYVKVTVKRKKK